MFEIQNFAGGGGDSETINGPAWAHFSDNNPGVGEEQKRYWGFIPSGKSIEYSQLNGLQPDSDNGTTTIQIVGLSGDFGSTTEITATLTGSLDDVTVTGSDADKLKITIGDKKYAVGADGKLTIALPDFGLMTKADKQKLDAIDTSTLLTKTEAANTYAPRETAITGGEMTAAGFVLKNALGNGVVTIPAQQ